MHAMMTFFPLLKLCFCTYGTYLYNVWGYSGDPSPLQSAMYQLLFVLFQIYFRLVLCLLAKGWRMVRELQKTDSYVVFLLIVGLSCSLMFRYLYVTNNEVPLLIAELFYIAFQTAILLYIFLSITKTINVLLREMLSYNIDVQNLESRFNVIRKYRIFNSYKIIMICWVALNGMEFFGSIMFFRSSDDSWINLMTSEFLDFFLCICIGYVFKPDSTNVFLDTFVPPENPNAVNNNYAPSTPTNITIDGIHSDNENESNSEANRNENNRDSGGGGEEEEDSRDENEDDGEIELTDMRLIRRNHNPGNEIVI